MPPSLEDWLSEGHLARFVAEVVEALDSRIMKDGATKEFVQAYNAQAVVDREAQVIVAAEVTQEKNDKKQLVPMLEQVIARLGSKPQWAMADAGYFTEAGVTDGRLEGIDLFVAPDMQKHSDAAMQ